MNIINDLNFMHSAIVPVSNNGVITANINWNLTNNTPGIVGAYSSKGPTSGDKHPYSIPESSTIEKKQI